MPKREEWKYNNPSAASLAISQWLKNKTKPLLIVTADSLLASQLENELAFFLNTELEEKSLEILHFPDWETLLYDRFSPHQDIISERLATLDALQKSKRSITLVSIHTLLHYVSPRIHLNQQTFLMAEGDMMDINRFRQHLTQAGYHNVDTVMNHGEFAVRGSIIDVFPMGSTTPYRIDLFDTAVDSIRTFDAETQRTLDKIKDIKLLPAKEFPITEEGINHFRHSWRETFDGNPALCPMYADLSNGIAIQGIEYYLPLFFDEAESLFDYLPAGGNIVTIGDVHTSAEQFWKTAQHRYEQLSHDRHRPILPPEKCLLSVNQAFEKINQHNQIRVSFDNVSVFPDLSMDHRAERPLAKLETFIEDCPGRTHRDNNSVILSDVRSTKPKDLASLKEEDPFDSPFGLAQGDTNRDHCYTILFCAESLGRREVFLELLKTIDVHPVVVESWNVFLEKTPKIAITVAPIVSGVVCHYKKQEPFDSQKALGQGDDIVDNILLISEGQLFGEQFIQQRRRRKQRVIDQEAIIKNLAEIKIGDPVVHLDNGIGRFLGLEIISVYDEPEEFLSLLYADNAKLYVPITSLHLISRYTGGDPDHAPLHRLGSDQWEKAKKKAAEKIKDVAAELLELYAQRESQPGHAFTNPEKDLQKFASEFPFEETPDQQTAIEAVMKDLFSKKPMDRLVCGDVGFGKTEVAMRACFIVAMSGKQVAMLVPTTLLANQHYENFKDRFANWPVNIHLLSRFVSTKNQKQTLSQLDTGKVDIVIGTHKLLQEDVHFNNLGLLVIDEEHRFGVTQKEKIKKLRAHVDILTLTATPIPRTLNMAMSGIRDISIIATPPARRLSIKTFVKATEPALVREAILREIMRGGQVFYLYNEVETIEHFARETEKLIPEARIGIGHGQMRERELEQVMSDFYHRRFNVLVCSTIIENGIDIPTANTILIHRADKFGLAQLHQLRGRVGRSHHQAYAYLLTPPEKAISKDAQKRLDAIASMEDLGAGFTLATHDLEIRGAGEFLGEDQSGNMEAVGFGLYMELLERTVAALKAGKKPPKDFHQEQTEIDLAIPALLPDDYMGDIYLRLQFYKRIAACEESGPLKNLQSELIDRFGLLPQPTKNLIAVTDIRNQAAALGIKKISANAKAITLTFKKDTLVDPGKIIHLISHDPRHYHMMGPLGLKFMIDTPDAAARLEAVVGLISLLK